MEAINLDTLHRRQFSLSFATEPTMVSIYLPFESHKQERRLETTVAAHLAEARLLLEDTLDADALDRFMEPLQQWHPTDLEDSSCKGVALFRSEKEFLQVPLHTAPPELLVVSDSYHVKPLLHCVAARPEAFVVGIQSRSAEVYKLTQGRLQHLATYFNDYEFAENRTGRKDFLAQRKTRKTIDNRFVQEVTQRISRAFDVRGKNFAVFGPRVLRKKMTSELLRRVQGEIFYEGGVASFTPRTANTIAAKLQKFSARHAEKMVGKIINKKGRGLITDCLDTIAEAAAQGRIDSLAVDPRKQTWGLYDRHLGLVKLHDQQQSSKDGCVVDDIVEEVIKKNGTVRFFESGQDAPHYIASLRW